MPRRGPQAKRACSGALSGRPASLRVNLAQLRRALRGRPEVLEALEAGVELPGQLKASGRPGVNVAQVWKLTMSAMYSSADVPVLGTREALQNASDSCAAAVKARVIRQADARFEVRWDEKSRKIEWIDSGIGMSAEDILERFLVLGASGKGTAASSDEAAGGFGVAKAVILGTASKFHWTLHTRDNLAVSKGENGDVEIFSAPFFQGARITAYGVSSDYDMWWDAAGGGPLPLEARLLELLSANDLPGLTLLYNGQEVRPRFSRRGGSKIEVIGSWGDGTTAVVKAYKRPDRRGAYWVRLAGLQQFKASSRGDLGVDVVVDLTTSVRPGEIGYPLNAGRDSLQGAARHAFQTLIAEVERENLSTGKNDEDEVFEPEGEPDNELLGDVHELTRGLLEDSELAGLLGDYPGHGLAGSTPGGATVGAGATSTEANSEAGNIGGVAPAPDGFGEPGAYGIPSGGAERGPSRPVLHTNLPDDHLLELSEYGGELPWFPAGFRTVDAIRAALERAEAESPYELTTAVIEALHAAEVDGKLVVAQLRTIAQAMDHAARLVAATRGMDTPAVEVSQRKSLKRNGNPFGHLGALRISRGNFDRSKARAFKRSPRKWLPHLILWSTALKLMAQAGGIQRALRPGFILDNSTIGLAQRLRDSAVVTIYINPERLAEVIASNKERPISIAGFLHGVATHELAHADGRMGESHSQAFVSAREDLGQRTVHLLPQLSVLAVRLLKLPEPADENAVRAARLEKQLEQAKAARDQLRKELRAESRKGERSVTQYQGVLGQIEAAEDRIRTLEGQLRACFAEVRSAGEWSSRRAQGECERRTVCDTSGAPEVVVVPPESGSDSSEVPSSTALNVLAAVRGILESAPPKGLEPNYVGRFFGRYNQHLARMVDGQLIALVSRGSDGRTHAER